MEIDEQKVKQLSEDAIWDIQSHLNRALDMNSGSGDHWILMACLNKHGFRTNGTDEAMRLAEEIIIIWYRLQK